MQQIEKKMPVEVIVSPELLGDGRSCNKKNTRKLEAQRTQSGYYKLSLASSVEMSAGWSFIP